MSPFETVGTIIAVFFVFGVAMGVLIVVALPRRRRSRYLDGGRWEEPPTVPDDDRQPPRWPGG